MINIHLNNLDASNLYIGTLQALEDICSQYGLENQFGTLSTANQEIVDFMQQWSDSFLLDVDFYIDNQQLEIVYRLPKLSAEALNQHLSVHEDNAVHFLADKLDYNSDNKSFTLTFHVKPVFRIIRERKYSFVTSQKHIL